MAARLATPPWAEFVNTGFVERFQCQVRYLGPTGPGERLRPVTVRAIAGTRVRATATAKVGRKLVGVMAEGKCAVDDELATGEETCRSLVCVADVESTRDYRLSLCLQGRSDSMPVCLPAR